MEYQKYRFAVCALFSRLVAPNFGSSAVAVRPFGIRPKQIRLASSLHGLVDLRLQHALVIVGRNRADQLVGDLAVAADNTRPWHAIDAPFDRGPLPSRPTDENGLP